MNFYVPANVDPGMIDVYISKNEPGILESRYYDEPRCGSFYGAKEGWYRLDCNGQQGSKVVI